jgi:hypothetical protein
MLRGKYVRMNTYINKTEISNKYPHHVPQVLRKTRTNQTQK